MTGNNERLRFQWRHCDCNNITKHNINSLGTTLLEFLHDTAAVSQTNTATCQCVLIAYASVIDCGHKSINRCAVHRPTDCTTSFSPLSQHCWSLGHPVNPLIGTLKLQNNGPLYSNTVIGNWPLTGGLLHLVQPEGAGRTVAPPRPLLSVPYVTAHPSQRPVYQLHIIRCSTTITSAL